MYISNLLQLILLVPFATIGAFVHDPYYCYTSDPIKPQIGGFSQLTPYDAVRGQNAINSSVSSCTPSKFWLVGRYGTRLPVAGEINDIINHHERLRSDVIANYLAGRTSLCHDDYQGIRDWEFDANITLASEFLLTDAGWNELEGIGRRYAAAFPTLLPSTYSPQQFRFRSTHHPRTRSSLEAFADGVFGQGGHRQVQFEDHPLPEDNDLLLRPHNACPLYSYVTANIAEHIAFTNGPEFLEVMTQISQKLGFHSHRQLRRPDIHIIGVLCRYEQIWNMSKTSPWCASTSVANFAVLEYARDLDFNWRMGYGPRDFRALYENLNCNLMQDLLRFVTSSDPNDHLSRVYSTIVETVPLLMVTLGAFEDELELTRHNFAELATRQWRSSRILAMASNLAVVKHSCADGDDDLLFLFNERPLQLPGCQADGLCKQAFVVERFSRFLNGNCAEIFCSNSSP